MPEISRFFCIVIRMFFEDHNPPHFHAEYGARRPWLIYMICPSALVGCRRARSDSSLSGPLSIRGNSSTIGEERSRGDPFKRSTRLSRKRMTEDPA